MDEPEGTGGDVFKSSPSAKWPIESVLVPRGTFNSCISGGPIGFAGFFFPSEEVDSGE